MYLLYHQRSKPTGEIIAQALNINHGMNANEVDRDLLIRWGSRRDSWIDGEFLKVINPFRSIALASDKLQSLQVMDNWEVDDLRINVPDWDEDPEALAERVGYPILGRKRHHARGMDVKLCLQRRDYRIRKDGTRASDYYIQYIPTVREFRIHVVGNEVIRVQGKFLDHPNEAVSYVRNFGTGYRFRAPRNRLNRRRLKMAINAVKSLGLDFGAVDLLIGDDGETYILEVNTAPSCSPLTGAEYTTAIARIAGINHTLNFEHLNLLSPDYEEGDSDDLAYEEMEE